MIKKIIFSAILFLFGLNRNIAHAKIATEPPDPTAWYDELLLSDEMPLIGPVTFIVVRKTSSHFELVQSDQTVDAFFGSVVPKDQVAFALDLNRASPPLGCTASGLNFGYCLGATYVLDITNANWQLSAINSGGELLAVFKGAGSPTGNYAEWIQNHLGFDGVILASRDGFLLAQVPATSIQGESQALAIADSQNKLFLGASQSQGSGLLSIVKRSGKLATLNTLVAKDGKNLNWKPGTKLIIDKN